MVAIVVVVAINVFELDSTFAGRRSVIVVSFDVGTSVSWNGDLLEIHIKLTNIKFWIEMRIDSICE